MTDGGKGDKRRRENTAQVEANWPTNWYAREDVQEVRVDTADADAEEE